MKDSKREEIEKLEKQLRKDLGETFGKDVVDAFETLSKALHKEIDDIEEKDKKPYDGSKIEELDKEIKDFAIHINKRIDEIKPELKKAGFGLVVASWSCGSPTVFMGAGSRRVVNDKVVPFIHEQLGED